MTIGQLQSAQADEHIEAALAAISDGHLVIGLDMAAQEDQWGLCAIRVTPDGAAGTMLALLPHYYTAGNGKISPSYMIRPTREHLARLLAAPLAPSARRVLAVDAPLGWPVHHGRFCSGYGMVRGWTGPDPLPSREEFEKRLTDRALSKLPQVSPFAIGADKIAQASYAWVQARAAIDVGAMRNGLPSEPAQKVTIETYPAAMVATIGRGYADYRDDLSLRGKLVQDWCTTRYPIADLVGSAQTGPCSWVDWATKQKGSPDAFDSLLCALAAWSYLRQELGSADEKVSTPEHLLGREPDATERAVIDREGWILIPTQ